MRRRGARIGEHTTCRVPDAAVHDVGLPQAASPYLVCLNNRRNCATHRFFLGVSFCCPTASVATDTNRHTQTSLRGERDFITNSRLS